MNANTTRSLTKNALAAAILAHRQATLEEIQTLPTAAESQKFYRLPLTCQFTGISCGNLTLATTAGYLPLLSQWKQQQVLHPVFSLEPLPLLNFSKNAWIRFCGFSQEEAEDAALTSKQEQILQVATLALLHQLTEVRQDVPWLPSFLDVQNNWQSLISLSYWKAYLDSQRFKFPQLRISKLEKDINLKAFLQTCWDKKKSYESSVNTLIEEAAQNTAEKALANIRDELAGKRPRSQKLLWRWFLANLPSRYSRDADGWMWDLFTASGDAVSEFTMADIDLFEEIFLTECPTGSSVSYAFLEILRSKRKLLETHFEAFEILVPMELQADAAEGLIPVAEPKLQDFEKKVQWMVAHAKWRLTHGSVNANKHRTAAIDKQQHVTVSPSFIPNLDTGRSRDFETAELETAEDEIDFVAPDSVAASRGDDAVTGEYEE